MSALKTRVSRDPEEPGIYWFKSASSPWTLVKLARPVQGLPMLFMCSQNNTPVGTVSNKRGMWCGPLDAPCPHPIFDSDAQMYYKDSTEKPNAQHVHQYNILQNGMAEEMKRLNAAAADYLSKHTETYYASAPTMHTEVEDILIAADSQSIEYRGDYMNFEDTYWNLGQETAAKDQKRGSSRLPSQVIPHSKSKHPIPSIS